jgi:hypothetical protein
MQKIIAILILISFIACKKSGDTPCGSYNGHSLYKGSSGGCYYINSSGNKEYVDRSFCNC